MEQEQTLYELLLQKGLTEEAAREIVTWIEANQQTYYYPAPAQGRTAQDWVSAVLKEPEVVKLINAAILREERLNELDNKLEEQFHGFLSRLDLRQKKYNIIFMVIGCAVILGVKMLDVITKETASTLITIIIGATLRDAISNYFKSNERE